MAMIELVINKGFVAHRSCEWLRKWWALEEKEYAERLQERGCEVALVVQF